MTADPRVLVVVSYFTDGSYYPRSGRPGRQEEVYWANIAVNGATLRRAAGPDPEYLVFTGTAPPEPAAGVLERAGATVRTLDFAHRPPDDFYIRYVGSLYVLDVMAALADEVDDDDIVLFVDPDIVWVRPIQPVIDDVRRGGVVAYDLAVPDTVPMCDLTRRQQGEVLAEMTGDGPGPDADALTHFGGEFYGMVGAELRAFVPELEALWAETLRRYESGQRHFNVEEHLVNAALWQRGEQHGRANEFIQRIRTLPPPFGTRDRVHPRLVAWHLPLEKDRGFLQVFRHLTARRTMPEDDQQYQRWLSRRMGIVPTGVRWAADRARQVSWKVTRREAGATAVHGL